MQTRRRLHTSCPAFCLAGAIDVAPSWGIGYSDPHVWELTPTGVSCTADLTFAYTDQEVMARRRANNQ